LKTIGILNPKALAIGLLSEKILGYKPIRKMVRL